MKLLIHGRNLEITPALQDYTQTVERATAHFGGAVREQTSISLWPAIPVSRNRPPRCGLRQRHRDRAQERSENLYASIDLAAGKLARQLRRWKERQTITTTAMAIAPATPPARMSSTMSPPLKPPSWRGNRRNCQTPACDANISPCHP